MRLLYALGALAVWIAAANAADPLASLYKSTLVITDSKGQMGRTLMNADPTFATFQPDGRVVKGTWRLERSQVCYTVTDPAQKPPMQACRPVAVHKVGDSWKVVQGGQLWTARLRAGR